MVKQRKSAKRGSFAATLLCAGSALLIAVPSAGLALGVIGNDTASGSSFASIGAFTPASVDPQLARLVFEHSGSASKQMRFTPAGSAHSGRSITVAVRIDENAARAISVRKVLTAADDAQMTAAAPRLIPMRYSLGAQRGYQGFAAPSAAPVLAPTLSDAAIPDLAAFRPSPGAKDKPSRFNARIALEEIEKTGREARTRESLGDQMVDVGGSYSVTRNLNVTAGIRYSQDRDRLEPVTNGKQDSQSVYVGTQFNF